MGHRVILPHSKAWRLYLPVFVSARSFGYSSTAEGARTFSAQARQYRSESSRKRKMDEDEITLHEIPSSQCPIKE